MDDKQRKQTVACSCSFVTCRSSKPPQCCYGTIKYLLVALAIYGPYVGAAVGVSLLIHVTGSCTTDKELKLYFTVWISTSFEVHWLKLGTKLFLDGGSDLSLALWREFRETQGSCVLTALGLVPKGKGGWWPAGHWVKHSCDKHQAAPCGVQADVVPCFLQEQAPDNSLREAAAQEGLQGAPWTKTLWFNEWGSVRFPGLTVLKEELQSSWRKAESFWNLQV